MNEKYVQPPPDTGYRMTWYEIRGGGPWPHTEVGVIFHKMDLSDLDEPYLSAVKSSLAADLTPKERDDC